MILNLMIVECMTKAVAGLIHHMRFVREDVKKRPPVFSYEVPSAFIYTDNEGIRHFATLSRHCIERFFVRYRKINSDFFTSFSDKYNLINTMKVVFSNCVIKYHPLYILLQIHKKLYF
jgi:hypothetical protein